MKKQWILRGLSLTLMACAAAPGWAMSFEFENGELRDASPVLPVEEEFVVRGQSCGTGCGYEPTDFSQPYDLFGCGLCGNLWEGTRIFFAGDGWANKADDDDSNNFGFRSGINMGIPISGYEPRIQLGVSYGAYDLHGREDSPNRTIEQQMFFTGGIYKRSQVCCGDPWAWGVVYDHVYGNAWGEDSDEFDMGQIRFLLGRAITDWDEIGVWGAAQAFSTTVTGLNNGAEIRPTNQLNFYWKRTWRYGAETNGYVGIGDGHTEAIFGLLGYAPLSDRFGVFGNTTYFLPSTTGGDTDPNGVDNSYAEESWNISFGFVYYPGCNAASPNVSGRRALPLLPLADNGSFNIFAPADDN